MANIGALSVSLSADTAQLQSDLGKAAAVADARARDIARSFGVVQSALASQKGISADVLTPYIKQLDQANTKQKETSHAMEEFSFKTAGAKRELLVLAHELSQGNYSKFGGSLLVLGERTGAASLLFSKAGLALLGLGGFAAAAAYSILQASNEVNEFNKALTNTGNYVGKTVDDLNRLSAAVAASTHSSTHSAAEVATAIAGSGKISGDSFQLVAEGATALSKTLGITAGDAVEYFTKLADEPTKASAKFNDTMHYLTASTYEHIKALEELGQKDQAGAVAIEALAKAAKAREDDQIAHLGVFARAWQMLGADALKAWDLIANVGRPATNDEKLKEARQTLADKLQRGPLNSTTGDAYAKGVASLKEQITAYEEVNRLAQKQAAIQADQAKTQQAGIRAIDAVDKWQKQEKGINAVNRELDKYHKQLDDIRKANPKSGLLDPKAVADGEEAIRKSFGGPKGAAPKAFQDDAATKFLETQRQVEASLTAQLAGESKLTAAEQEKVKFTQLIADLKGKTILTAEQQSLLANKDAIQVQLDKNAALSEQIQYEKKIAELAADSAAKSERFRQSIEGINAAMQQSQQGRSEQYDRALAVFGQGDAERQQVDAQKSIRKEYQKELAKLDAEASKDDSLGSGRYIKAAADIQAALDAALAGQRKYYADVKAKQAEWTNGATQALSNYIDSVHNLAEETNKAFTNGFNGAENALTSFVTTGKADFKSFANSIIADLARIAIRQSITGPLANGLLGMFGGGNSINGDADYLKMIGLSGGSSGLSISGARAAGGPVSGGSAYLVGEKGPELFVPTASGSIIPNGGSGGGSSGGQPLTVVQNFTVGDVATVGMVRAAVSGSEKRIGGAIARSQKYGGAMA